MIRLAHSADCNAIIGLLHEVSMVHHTIRPDIFKPNTTKYSETELLHIINNSATTPIFVYENDKNGEILGYAFCQLQVTQQNILLHDMKTLYIDDICVNENARGKHIGKALYEHVANYAREIGCYNLTLNVWEGNDAAKQFYLKQDMHVLKTCMEYIL